MKTIHQQEIEDWNKSQYQIPTKTFYDPMTAILTVAYVENRHGKRRINVSYIDTVHPAVLPEDDLCANAFDIWEKDIKEFANEQKCDLGSY